MTGSGRTAVVSWAEALAVFLVYAALTAVATWPWAAAPGRLAWPTPDYLGHVWGLAWVVRQAGMDPAHLFDANMYWPHAQSLAFTESLLAQAVQAAPFRWLGADPVLAHNAVLLLTFPSSGLGLYLLARELGAGRGGAAVGGLGFAFLGFRYQHLTQIGVVSVQWFPFVLWAWLQAVRTGTAASLVALAAFCVLQAMSSGYHALLLGIMLGLSAVCFAGEMKRRGTWGRVALALGAAGLVAAALAWPYRELRQRRPLVRSREECVHWSARLASFADPGRHSRGLLYPEPLRRALRGSPEPLSPGLLLGVAAVVGACLTRREGTTRWLLAIGAASALLALGPELQDLPGRPPGPFDLLRRLPFFDMIRVPSRFGVGAVLAADALAALALSRLFAARARHAGVAALGAGALVFAELLPEPLERHLRPAPEPSGFVRFLADAPRGPVLELPWDSEEAGGPYLYWSTWHWQPMVNGHGTFPAPGNLGLGRLGRRFPAPFATRALRCAGVRYVVVHLDRVEEGQMRLLEGEPAFGAVLAASYGLDRVYALAPPEEGECGRLPRPDGWPEPGEKEKGLSEN